MSDNSKAVLSDKPVNTAIASGPIEGDKSMDFQRQMLHSKLNDNGLVFFLDSRRNTDLSNRSNQTYISPSDNLMSPCTAKLSGLKNKHFMKYVASSSCDFRVLCHNADCFKEPSHNLSLERNRTCLPAATCSRAQEARRFRVLVAI